MAPAMADDRLYNTGAALERELLARWGKPLLEMAPELL
jgi:aspartyl-tRNA(Asn)/glutamyl-tRNA(Gln) amidotransferase subunit A